MKQLAMLLAVAAAVAVALPGADAVAQSGTCGKGKVWDPAKEKCVKKPKSGGSGSGAAVN